MKNQLIHLRPIILFVVMGLFFQNVYAGNAYGLKDKIQDGVILHCFDWTYSQIEAKLPEIADAGFSAVQTSPAQPDASNSAWYWLYQPYDFKVGTNGLGTKSQLTELCTNAHKYGIKIIVDVVANHTKGDISYCASWLQNTNLYHNYGSSIDYSNRYSITHGDIGMKDLATENTTVQDSVHHYIEALKSCGVDGIRWDAAKHIGLPSEGDTFWENVPDQEMYNYGEILDGTGGDNETLFPEYQKYISITDNTYGNSLASSFNSNSVPSSIGAFNQEGAETDKLVYWGESHDTYCNDDGVSKNYSQNVVDRAYAIAAGNNGATALYFSRPSSSSNSSIYIGVEGSSHFTSSEVVEVNRFHNLCAGEANYYVHENNVAAQCREKGAVIVLGNGSNQSISCTNGGGYVTPGTYTDHISGNTFTVTASVISGTVGSTGIAVIYNDTTSSTSSDDSTSTDTTVYYTPTVTSSEVSCFLESTTRSANLTAWVWSDSANYTVGGTWPGDTLVYEGVAPDGNYIYKWTYQGSLAALPTGLIFCKDGKKIVDSDLDFVNHGYYIDAVYNKTITASDTATEDSTTTEVSVTLSHDEMAYSSPYPLNYNNLSGLTAYIASGYYVIGGELNIVLSKIDYVPEGTGVILEGTSGETYVIPTHSYQTGVANMLQAVLKDTTIRSSEGSLFNYVLLSSTNTFEAVADSAEMSENSCYLQINDSILSLASSSNSKSVKFVYKDITSGIDSVSSDAEKEDSYYSISGVKMAKPTQKGIYIHRGRKYMIK